MTDAFRVVQMVQMLGLGRRPDRFSLVIVSELDPDFVKASHMIK